MVRPYGIKVKGHKKRKQEERYDRDEGKDLGEQPEAKASRAEIGGSGDEGEKGGEGGVPEREENGKEVGWGAENQLAAIPVVPRQIQSKDSGVIFVLEKASLEVAKVGKTYQLLSSDDHANFLRKNNKNPNDYRPDIVHQALLSILDSPLNKAGRLRAVYVRTEKNVLFEVNPHVRLPRTFKRFAGIMQQLLQKLSITAVGKREKLMRVIKNPVTKYLPVNSRKIGFSRSSEKLVQVKDFVDAFPDDVNLVFVVGAMAHGKIDHDYTDDYIAVSDYPLSAACCISRICHALEDKWKIL